MYTKYKTKEIVNIVINGVAVAGEIRGVRTLDMVDDNGEEYGMIDYLILPTRFRRNAVGGRNYTLGNEY